MLIGCLAALCVACHVSPLLPPWKKKVTEKDIVGVWKLSGEKERTGCDIDFIAYAPVGAVVWAGKLEDMPDEFPATWEFSFAEVGSANYTAIMLHQPPPRHVGWPILDMYCVDRSGKLTLQSADPDSLILFTRVRRSAPMVMKKLEREE
ncbi:hypothetical protein KQI84_18405 [bacterium]|nr:hypothetical protein [bacterium]